MYIVLSIAKTELHIQSKAAIHALRHVEGGPYLHPPPDQADLRIEAY